MYPRIAIKDFFSDNEINVSKYIQTIEDYETWFIPTTNHSDVMTNCIENNSVMGINEDDEDDIDTSEKIGYYLLENERYDKQIYQNIHDYIFANNVNNGQIPVSTLDKVIRMFDTYKSIVGCINKMQNNRMVHCNLNKNNILVSQDNPHQTSLINFSKSLIIKNIKIKYLQNLFDNSDESPHHQSLEMLCLQILLPIINTDKFVLDECTRTHITTLYIAINPIFKMLSDDFKREYNKLINDYLKQYDGLSKEQLLKSLLNTCVHWDMHSISILYMEFINEMFDGNFIKNDLIILFVQLLLKTINPFMRQNITSTLKELDEIHSINGQYDNIMNLI